MTVPSEAGSVFSHVLELVARRDYDAARGVLEAELWRSPDNTAVRQQLADVLALSGNVDAAADVLTALAESLAEKGQTAKAIAALKRVQVLAPDRGDEHGRLARLLKSRDGGTVPVPPSPPRPAPSSSNEDPTGVVEILKQLPPGEILEPDPDPAPAVSRETVKGSPLFSSFSAEELEAVIFGMRLVTVEPGDIVVTEGETGSSLFVLTTGIVKAFVRDAGGRNHRVRQLGEGSFFGEVSILTGRPRSATIVAAERCELLELDRQTLDRILPAHPRVLAVLQTFSAARVSSAAEALARRGE